MTQATDPAALASGPGQRQSPPGPSPGQRRGQGPHAFSTRDVGRASAFSDAIFAIALTLPVLALTLPVADRAVVPLNIQRAGALLDFGSFRLPGEQVGLLYLVLLGATAQRWLMLSASDRGDRVLLDTVARHVTLSHSRW